MANKIKFNGCIHLDFNPNYDAKRQQTDMGLFWLREQDPGMVQFCKLKGRIYGCQSCLSQENKQCNSYEEIEHCISISIEELNS